MAKHTFSYYLHDENLFENAYWVADQNNLSEEVVKEIAAINPFYEVEIMCEYDDETKETRLYLP